VAVCQHSDAGAPIVVSEPQSPCALAYTDMARRLLAKLMQGHEQGPNIVIE